MRILLAALFIPALAFAEKVTLPSGVVAPAFFAKQGIDVTGYKKISSGLNVWYVKKDETKTVFYTTPDNKVLISGVMWDAASGANLSDSYITKDLSVSKSGGQAQKPEQVQGSAGSAEILGVASLTGVKEGNASADKTLYIVFDPRCPYCHNVYKKTRDFVKSGGTIKWLPVTVLGDNANGMRLVAQIMQSKNPVAALGTVMGKKTGGETANMETQKTLAQNEAYFFSAFSKNKGAGAPGVPVAFFETADGAPQMVAGVDDDILLKRIYKDIKK